MPLVMVIGAAIGFFITAATCLLPEITLVLVFTTLKLCGKWGPSPLTGTESLHGYCFTEAGFLFGCVLFWMQKHLSNAHQHANNWAILDPFKETINSSISLSLITLMIQLMVGVPRVTGTQDPKPVESSMTRAT